MRKKEQMFWLASRSRMWRIPLCMAAFSLLPSAYSFASAENPATETVLAVNSVQQQRTVKGIVIDANGEAVIGANVKEPGSTTGTITDMNGEFSLSVGPKATLEISFIGYTTQKVNVGASNTVKVILKEDTKVLDEVVITGFGMSQKKATLTGAVAAIASTDIERSNATTASGALVGKIAGINTRQNDGRPGASTQLQIRNMGAPLYVIDGVVSDDGQFNHMDFNDIESISILKDASAAIYGVRAANGVVVVTSKKGQRNSKNSVSINAYYGWQHNSRYVQPAKTKDYVNAYVSAETWAKKADNDRRYNKEEYAKWMAGTEKNYQGFDWSDYIWITAPQSYISANLSGGTDKANYYVAVSHIDQEATVRGYGGFRRTNAQMNIDMNISDRFKIGATMNGRIEDRHHPGVPGGDDTWLPRFATMKNQPTKRPYANDNPLYPQLVSDQKETNFALLNYDTSGKVSDVWRVIQMQTTAEYEILKGLKAKGMPGIKISNLLMVAAENEDLVMDLVQGSGITCFCVMRTTKKTAFLLYRKAKLEAYIFKPEVQQLLRKLGYEDFSLENVLHSFRKKYQAHMNQGKQFPHEMGLLLGYPVEDVVGFMENNGKNYLYSGYWKVYADVPAKKHIFTRYDEARETLIRLLANDIGIRLIFEIYRDESIKEIAV